MPFGDKGSEKENKTHKCSGRNRTDFLPGAPRSLAPVCNGLQPSLGLRSTRGSRPRDTWTRVLAQPRDAGSAGPLPPDSLCKAVRGGEHPAAVEQARSAAVDFIPSQATLPWPAPKPGLISTHHAHLDALEATRPWDGQTDTRLSCGRQAHPAHPHPLGREGTPGGTARPGVCHPGRVERWGPAPRGPRAPAPSCPLVPRAHRLHESIDEF